MNRTSACHITRRIAPAVLALSLVLGGVGYSSFSMAKTVAKPAAKPAAASPTTPAKPAATADTTTAALPAADYQEVSPLDIVKSPDTYLNKDVAFEGTFNRFADIALDYKKAFRDSREYVTMLILRPDVKDHDIPLSELKLFFPRKKSDEVTNLDTGDVVSIRGHVFSDALGDPWVDISAIKVVLKKEKEGKKSTSECC